MNIDVPITIGGSVVLAIISALAGASMDTKGQRRQAQAIAKERQAIAKEKQAIDKATQAYRVERLKLQRERARLDSAHRRNLNRARVGVRNNRRAPRGR